MRRPMPGMTRRAWILPRAGKNVLCTLAEQGYRDSLPPVVELGAVPMPRFAPHVADLEAGVVAWSRGSSLRILRDLDTLSGTPVRVELPRATSIHTLTLHEQVLYAGGAGGWFDGPVLGMVVLQGRPSPSWQPFDAPTVMVRKAIDGLVLHGARLLAVDDLTWPRYLLIYDIANPLLPRLSEVRDLPRPGPGERTLSMVFGNQVLAMLATGMHQGRERVRVRVFDLATFEERAVLSCERRSKYGQQGKHGERLVDFSRMALAGDRLLLAAGEDGIGILHVGASAPWLARVPGPPQRIPLDAVRFVPANGHHVVDVVPVDSIYAFAIVTPQGVRDPGGELDTVLVRLG